MNKQTIQNLRAVISTTLASAGVANGVEFQIGNATYDDISVTFKLTAVEVAEGQDAEQLIFNRDCGLIGLLPEHFGRSFTVNGKTVSICGVKLKNYKHPVICQGPRGKFKVEADRVLKQLELAAERGEAIPHSDQKRTLIFFSS